MSVSVKKSVGETLNGLRLRNIPLIPAFSTLFSRGDIYAQFKYVVPRVNENLERCSGSIACGVKISKHKLFDRFQKLGLPFLAGGNACDVIYNL